MEWNVLALQSLHEDQRARASIEVIVFPTNQRMEAMHALPSKNPSRTMHDMLPIQVCPAECDWNLFIHWLSVCFHHSTGFKFRTLDSFPGCCLQDFQEAAKLSDGLLGHYSATWRDRSVYYLARERAKCQKDLLVMIQDTYDHTKMSLPAWPRRRCPKKPIFEATKSNMSWTVRVWFCV